MIIATISRQAAELSEDCFIQQPLGKEGASKGLRDLPKGPQAGTHNLQ